MNLHPVKQSEFDLLPEYLKDPLRQSGALPVGDLFYPLWEAKNINTVVLIGGRGGAKTYEASRYIAGSAAVMKKRCAVLRDEKETIKESILSEILQRYEDIGEYISLESECQKLDIGIKDKKTGEMLVFTKGFRASDNKKRANLKSISNVDIAIVEEAEDIRDSNKFNTFADSIRKEGSKIIIILNTPDIGHWILKRYFNLEQITFDDVPHLKGKVKETDIDGYFKITPKKLDGFMCIQVNYDDNKHLPKHIVSSYEAYGDPQDPKYDLHYYLTAIKGFASSGRKGQVLKKVKPIKLADYLALPFKEYYGQDFGTSSPAGLVGVKFDKNRCYVRQLNYSPMTPLELGKLYCTLNFSLSDRIIADNADEKTWKKLRRGWEKHELEESVFKQYPNLLRGFSVFPCVKGQDSIRDGISTMNDMELFAVEEHKELWEEIINYVYAKDKNENYTNDPIDDFNHLIDPWRYVVQDQRGKKKFTITTG